MQAELDPSILEWDSFVAAVPDSHILQASAWCDLKSAFGWYGRRIALRNGRHIVAGAQVLFRRLPIGRTLAYVPKGPLVGIHTDACPALLDALHDVCRSERAILLKIEPDLFESVPLSQQLASYGFHPSAHTVQPRRTILVDITGTEKEILARMKSKTRYNIRLAARRDVRVDPGRPTDMNTFNRLMAVTGQRDDFGVHSPAYYERAHDILGRADMARLFMATYDGEPLAGLMACACGHKAWYMYGASGNEHRDRMPTYALQWAAIQWSRSRGCTSYDLWGVPDQDEETLEDCFAERHDGLWGVYRHKRGYGGQVVRYAGAFDYVYSRPLYRIYSLALKLRNQSV